MSKEKDLLRNGSSTALKEAVKLRVEIEPGTGELSVARLAVATSFEDKRGKTPRLAVRIGKRVLNSIHQGEGMDVVTGEKFRVQPDDLTVLPIRTGEKLELAVIRAAAESSEVQ